MVYNENETEISSLIENGSVLVYEAKGAYLWIWAEAHKSYWVIDEAGLKSGYKLPSIQSIIKANLEV